MLNSCIFLPFLGVAQPLLRGKGPERGGDMTITLGSNGFGRIGRCTLAHIAGSNRNDAQVVAINATGPVETNAHLLRYDSVHGRFPGTVKVTDGGLDLGRGPIRVLSTRNPEDLDWEGVDGVLECAGTFNDRDQAAAQSGCPPRMPAPST
jgi:glyceraldehyde 3-phosphate dehydrogenase